MNQKYLQVTEWNEMTERESERSKETSKASMQLTPQSGAIRTVIFVSNFIALLQININFVHCFFLKKTSQHY